MTISRTPKSGRIQNCVFCAAPLSDNNYSKDHVFPQAIGGSYFVEFVCSKCNNEFGHQFESDLAQNPYALAAAAKLGLPLTPKVEKLQGYSMRGFSGEMYHSKNTGTPVFKPTVYGDTLLGSEETMKGKIAANLRRMGFPADFIQRNFLSVYDSAPSNIWIPIPLTGEWFVKREEEQVTIESTISGIPFRYALIAKIAIELIIASGLWWDVQIEMDPLAQSV